MKHLQKRVHALTEDAFDDRYDVVMTNGSQDGICKAMEMLINAGDAVVLEEYVYSSVLSILDPYRPDYVVVEADGEGMHADSLEGVLHTRFGSPEQARKNPK
jgi:DNA-binding transcriptional MocR family regulator